jgi:hypothetical protein
MIPGPGFERGFGLGFVIGVVVTIFIVWAVLKGPIGLGE